MEENRQTVVSKLLKKKVLFSSELFEIEAEMVTAEFAMTVKMIEKAVLGDVKAYTAVMDNCYLPHTREVINSLKSDMPILLNWDNKVEVPDESIDKQGEKIRRRAEKKEAKISNNARVQQVKNEIKNNK